MRRDCSPALPVLIELGPVSLNLVNFGVADQIE
jgi:hypothetical protein